MQPFCGTLGKCHPFTLSTAWGAREVFAMPTFGFKARPRLRGGRKVDQDGNPGPSATPAKQNNAGGHDWSAFDRSFPGSGSAGPKGPAGIANPPPVTRRIVPRGTSAEQAAGASADPFMPTATGPIVIPQATGTKGNAATDRAGLAANRTLYSPGTAGRVAPPKAIGGTAPMPDVFTSRAEAAKIALAHRDPTGGRIQNNPTPGTVSYAGDGSNMPKNVAPLYPTAATVAANPSPNAPTVVARPPVQTAPVVAQPSAAGTKGAPGKAGNAGAAPSEPVTANAVGQTVRAIPGEVANAAGEMAGAAGNAANAAVGAFDRVGSSFVAGVQGKTDEQWAAEKAAITAQRAASEKMGQRDVFTPPARPATPVAPSMTTGPMAMSTFTGVQPPPRRPLPPSATSAAMATPAPDNTGAGLMPNPAAKPTIQPAPVTTPIHTPTMEDAFTPRSAAPVVQPSLPQMQQDAKQQVPKPPAFRTTPPTIQPVPVPSFRDMPPELPVAPDVFTPATGAPQMAQNSEDELRKRVASGYPAMS